MTETTLPLIRTLSAGRTMGMYSGFGLAGCKPHVAPLAVEVLQRRLLVTLEPRGHHVAVCRRSPDSAG